MFPIRDNQMSRATPIVTYTIIALNVAIYVWDRQGSLLGPSIVFADLGMRPRDVIGAVAGGQDRLPMVTLFSSLFLHGGPLHLLGNLLFLLVFGPAVEEALGGPRYVLYYLFWGIVASATHIFVDPRSSIPTIGASGAIGGVLGSYFLLFPANKIEMIVWLIPWRVIVSAWVLLGFWFLYQIFVRQEGVANWAHAGGFMAGMATVLVMGGRGAVMRGRPRELIDDFE